MNKKLLLLIVLMLCTISTLYAQEMTITGSVIDEAGMPLPGVNIVVTLMVIIQLLPQAGRF